MRVHPSSHSGQIGTALHITHTTNTHLGEIRVSDWPHVHVLYIGRKPKYLDRTILEKMLKYFCHDVLQSTAPPCLC